MDFRSAMQLSGSRGCPFWILGGSAILRTMPKTQDPEFIVCWDCSSFVVTSQSVGDAFATGSEGSHPRRHAVIDSETTETVGSLLAVQDLMRIRCEVKGSPDSFQIPSTPPRKFRFGNGAVGHTPRLKSPGSNSVYSP